MNPSTVYNRSLWFCEKSQKIYTLKIESLYIPPIIIFNRVWILMISSNCTSSIFTELSFLQSLTIYCVFFEWRNPFGNKNFVFLSWLNFEKTIFALRDELNILWCIWISQNEGSFLDNYSCYVKYPASKTYNQNYTHDDGDQMKYESWRTFQKWISMIWKMWGVNQSIGRTHI